MNDENVKNVKEMVGRFAKRVQLNYQNHRKVWPFCDHRPMLDDPRPRLFSLSSGWEVIGYCKAPYASERGYKNALVLEFDGRENWDDDERGIHWIHCDLKEMNFIPR